MPSSPTLTRVTRLGMVNAYLVREDDGLTLVDAAAAPQRQGDPQGRARHRRADPPDRADPRPRRPHRLARRARGAVAGRRGPISARDARLLPKDKSLDPGEGGKLRGSYPGARPARRARSLRATGSARSRSSPRPATRPATSRSSTRATAPCCAATRTRRSAASRCPAKPTRASRCLAGDLAPADGARDRPRAARADPARLAPGHGKIVEDPGAAMDAAIARAAG